MAKKFLTPVVPPSLSSDPSGAVAGAIYYNTEVNALKFYDGTTWSIIGTGGGGGSNTAFEVLDEAPSSPTQGRVYFDTQERTVKLYNGVIWYDVAGPKELIDHVHYTDGYVRTAEYGGYVSNKNYLVSIDGGGSNTDYTLPSNNDIIDGGAA